MQSLLSSATSSAADPLARPGSDRAWSLEPRPYGWCGRFRAMASPCELHLGRVSKKLAQRLTDSVCAEALRIEQKFSRYRDDNLIARINSARGEPVLIDPETSRLLDYAAELFALSDGRFDITSGVLRRAWTFDGGEGVPDPEQIEALRPKVGWDRVSWRDHLLCMQEGMEIDLGGIGKEYAVDRAAALVRDAVDKGMVNFGGDLVSIGAPDDAPGKAGSWTVGIESLAGRDAAKRVSLKTGALATSGDTRRFVLKEGRRYGHILDARTGWPVEHAPRSITVLAGNCTQAGMLATFAMLMGEKAESFLEQQGLRFWCLR